MEIYLRSAFFDSIPSKILAIDVSCEGFSIIKLSAASARAIVFVTMSKRWLLIIVGWNVHVIKTGRMLTME